MTSSDWKSAFSPRKTPSFANYPWQRFIGWFLVPFFFLCLLEPNVVADVADTVILPYQMFAGLRWAIAGIALYILLYRRLHAWEVPALTCAIFGVLGNYSQNTMIHAPLELSDLLVRLALGAFVLRRFFRPTPYEDHVAAGQLKQENTALKQRLENYERL